MICTMPGCQTTAGCICSRAAQQRSVQTFRLRRRREMVTAEEVLRWIEQQPSDSGWMATKKGIELALYEITR